MQDEKNGCSKFQFWPQTINFTAGTVYLGYLSPDVRETIFATIKGTSKTMLHRPMAGQQALNL